MILRAASGGRIRASRSREDPCAASAANMLPSASCIALLTFSGLSAAAFPGLGPGPLPGQIKNLVTFGDSYTDVISKVTPGVAQRAELLTIASTRLLRAIIASLGQYSAGWPLQTFPICTRRRHLLQQYHLPPISFALREPAPALLHRKAKRLPSPKPGRDHLHALDWDQRCRSQLIDRRRGCARFDDR